MIDENDIVDVVDAADVLYGPDLRVPFAAFLLQAGKKDIVHER